MQSQLATVSNFLTRMIKEAELREAKRHSLADFATRVRRDTAKEILAFVQSLSAAETLSRERGGVPRHGRDARVEIPGLGMGAAPQRERSAPAAGDALS